MRLDEWPRLLAGFIEGARASEFDWRRCNCFHLTADAVLTITGVDFLKPLRGATYKTERGALGALRRFVGPAAKGLSADGLVEAAAERLCADNGFAEIGPLYAQRGDICLVEAAVAGAAVGVALGVCLGSRIVVLARQGGLVDLPIVAARRAWRV